jgi:hypothetical protein
VVIHRGFFGAARLCGWPIHHAPRHIRNTLRGRSERDNHNTQIMAKLAQLIEGGNYRSRLDLLLCHDRHARGVVEQQRYAPHWPSLVAKAANFDLRAQA